MPLLLLLGTAVSILSDATLASSIWTTCQLEMKLVGLHPDS